MAENRRKRIRTLRKALLTKLVSKIESGQFSNVEESVESLFPLHSGRTERFVPRGEYKSPLERDTYNYGYTEIDELTGLDTPNVWE